MMDSLLSFVILPALSFPLGALLNSFSAKRATVVQPDAPTWPENYTWVFSNGVWVPVSPPIVEYQEGKTSRSYHSQSKQSANAHAVAVAAIARSEIPSTSRSLEQRPVDVNFLLELILLVLFFFFFVALPCFRWLYHVAGAFDSNLIEAFGFMEDLDDMHTIDQDPLLPPPTGRKQQAETTFDERQGVSGSKINAADDDSKQLDQLRNEFEASRRQNDDAIALVLAGLNQRDEDFKELQTNYQQLEVAHKALQKDYDTLRTSHSRLQDCHTDILNSLIQLTDSGNELWKAHGDLCDDHDALKETHDSLKEDHDTLQENHDTLQENHTMLGQLHSALEDDFDSFRSAYYDDKEAAFCAEVKAATLSFSSSAPSEFSDGTDSLLAIADESDASNQSSPSVGPRAESLIVNLRLPLSSTVAPGQVASATSTSQGVASTTTPPAPLPTPTRSSAQSSPSTQPSCQPAIPTVAGPSKASLIQPGPSRTAATASSTQVTPSTQPGTSSTPSTSTEMTPKEAKQLRSEGRISEIAWCGHETKEGKCRTHNNRKTGRINYHYRHNGE